MLALPSPRFPLPRHCNAHSAACFLLRSEARFSSASQRAQGLARARRQLPELASPPPTHLAPSHLALRLASPPAPSPPASLHFPSSSVRLDEASPPSGVAATKQRRLHHAARAPQSRSSPCTGHARGARGCNRCSDWAVAAPTAAVAATVAGHGGIARMWGGGERPGAARGPGAS